MENIEFTKMHGLGNDFVIIDISMIEGLINDMTHFVKLVANRRFGVGCDQVIFYRKMDEINYEMYIYNADGSSAKACGNGTRCLAALINIERIFIHIGDRKLECRIEQDGEISVNMGNISFQESWMPSAKDIWDDVLSIYNIDLREICCVDVGNPHVVILNNSLSYDDKALIGKILETHKLFSSGVNVNFAHIRDHGIIDLIVWERGYGFTLACGSGACATFASTRKNKFINEDNVKIRFAHGTLLMKYVGNDIIMKGSATLVAKGASLYLCSGQGSANQAP